MKRAIVIGTIGADIHVVAIKIFECLLKGRGFRVINLGAMTSEDDFVDVASRSGAVAVLISSLYGHALRDCSGLMEKKKIYGLDNILFYIGGNLEVGSCDAVEVSKKFRELGFDRVFLSDASFNDVIITLEHDIGSCNDISANHDTASRFSSICSRQVGADIL